MSTPPREFGALPPHPAPPLVGRDRELATLREHLAATLAGWGSLVLIGGEAGIGKTALAEALCAEARERGATVLVGRCYDLAETPPYGPWAEALAHAPVDDELPVLPAAVLPPEDDGVALASQDAIVRRVLAYLAALAARQPLVLLLEDLHWADPASLDLLRATGRAPAHRPVLLLATYRTDEVVNDHPLAALLPTLVRESRAERLDLRPLDAGAIGALVAARYALADAEQDRLMRYLAARTEGNALFLGELLRTLEGEGMLRREGGRWVVGDLTAVPVPALLRQVIGGRLARLGGETGRLLALAATVGQEVPLALWAAVAGTDEDGLLDAVERATGARLLVEAA
ncbi:MAG: AAA family ATPase, partial [Chloroflexota bacterium]|nr:AAA family ATPase [Chloroflexota bacterium]